MNKMKKYIYSTLLVIAASAAFAEIKMSAIFGNDMMFQQNKPINIWGSADANSRVKVSFNAKDAETKADASGKWEVSLPAQKASFEPKKLAVFENGKLEKEFSNILVGEVWIAGGQSNMEWKVKSSSDKLKAIESAKKLNGKMRYFLQSSDAYSKVPKSEFQEGSKWIIVNETNVGGTSAVGFYFAERLLDDLNVPVGLIYAAKGGSRMVAWTDKETILRGWSKHHADIVKLLETYDEAAYQKAKKTYDEKIAEYNATVAKAEKEGKKPPKKHWELQYYVPSKESPTVQEKTPTLHFNGKIAPMRNFSVRGVLWYQGESDSYGNLLKNYNKSFEMLINSWRKSLKDDELPFLQVQLASFGLLKDWAPTREAQYQNTKLFKNVYMSQTVDSGAESDIHPRDKTIVGRRLEKVALDKIYNVKSVKSDAPIVESIEYLGDNAVVSFNGMGAKVVCKGDVRGFEILIDGKWVPAKAEFKNGKVVVKSTDNKVIDGVRYLWKNWTLPEVCIYGDNEMPAIPFERFKKNAGI